MYSSLKVSNNTFTFDKISYKSEKV